MPASCRALRFLRTSSAISAINNSPDSSGSLEGWEGGDPADILDRIFRRWYAAPRDPGGVADRPFLARRRRGGDGGHRAAGARGRLAPRPPPVSRQGAD